MTEHEFERDSRLIPSGTPQDLPMEWGADIGLVLPNLIQTRASDMGSRIFLQEAGGREQTYAEVYESSLQWADALRAAGVRVGDAVASFMLPCLEAHHLWIGTAWLRAPEVPINTDYRTELLVHTLTTCSAQIVVTTPMLLPRLAEVIAQLPLLRQIVVIGANRPAALPDSAVEVISGDAFLASGVRDAEYEAPEPSDLAAILYTSGTTGPSKGVRVRWAQFSTGIGMAPPEWFRPGDAFYVPYPTYHVTGKVPLVSMANVGGRVVMRPVFSASAFWDDVRRYDCRATVVMGAIMHFIGWREISGPADCPLRLITVAPGVPEVDELKDRLGVRVTIAYGMTEIGWPLINHDVVGEAFDSLGHIRPGYSLRVVDPEGDDVQRGMVGELLVRAENPDVLSAGYLNPPASDGEAIDDGWFHTGDALRQNDDGSFVFVDRIKDAIRRRGENISSYEVEQYVLGHRAVSECAVVAVPSEYGEDEVKAVIVLHPEASPDAADLFRWYAERMPRFMVPRYIEFVDVLPRTETGKTRKAVLRSRGLSMDTFDRTQLGISIPKSPQP